MKMSKWTQDQAVAFEAARECITDMMGIRSGEIAEEEAKTRPDGVRLAQLEAELTSLAQERTELTLADEDRVATVRKIYGAAIREYRARQQKQAA